MAEKRAEEATARAAQAAEEAKQREAEEKVKDEPAQGIVYGLMQAAVLFGQDRTTEGLAIIRRLDKAYPTHRREMGALITLLRRRGDVRMPPRVPREP